jgi:hypothetical protein
MLVFDYVKDCVADVCVWMFWTVGCMVGMVGCTGLWFSLPVLFQFSSAGLLEYLFFCGFSGLIHVGLLPFLWVSECIMKR